jgi:hypothetical protein
MYKTFLGIGALVLLVAPTTSQAAGPESFDLLFSDDVYLEEEVSTFSALHDGVVLGASTDDETSTMPVVSKKLGTPINSYFRDISIKPPKDWYLSDEFDEGEAYATYIVNEEMTAQVAVFRFHDEKMTLKSLEKETEALCELCGYKIEKKGNAKLGKLKGRYIEATSPDTHFMLYLFDIGDISYVIQTSAPLEEWGYYKGILAKSYASIKINSKKLTSE